MKWYPKNLHDLTLLLLKIWKYSYSAFPTYILKKIDIQPSTQVFLKKCNSQFVGLIFVLGDVILYVKYHEIDY
jgi:hypothetical protein